MVSKRERQFYDVLHFPDTQDERSGWEKAEGKRKKAEVIGLSLLHSAFCLLTFALKLTPMGARPFQHNSLRGRADRIKMRAHNHDADASKNSSTQNRPVIG